jgi:DNA-binding response OmpR family regulator
MSSHKILIVDDDAVILQALRTKLTGAGFAVLTEQDGSSALTVLRHVKPDLILLDVTFPPDIIHGGGTAWDGFRLMSWIREKSKVKVPIIIMTASQGAEVQTKAATGGAAGFFRKPIDGNELVNFIRVTLAASSGKEAVPV